MFSFTNAMQQAARKANNCSRSRESSAAQPRRKPRIGAASQGTAQPEPEQFIGFVAASTQKGPNPKARPRKPEQIPMPAARKPESRPRKSSPHPENGVICPIMGLFAIFCYIYHLFYSWRYVLHPTLCHTLKLCKLFKHLLPTHLRYIFMHDMAFIYE